MRQMQKLLLHSSPLAGLGKESMLYLFVHQTYSFQKIIFRSCLMRIAKVTSIVLLFLAQLWGGCSYAQVAGLTSHAIFDMTTSARVAALGMDFLALPANDLSVALSNPSLIDGQYKNRLNLDYVGLFSGAKRGAVALGFESHSLGDFVAGFQFNSFGKFQGYDEFDQSTGSFFAADYLFYLGWGLHIDSNFSIGASLKPLLSQYEQYHAFAFALDVAGSYLSDSRRFVATIMLRNMGAQLVTFEQSVEPVPWQLAAAISYKLENAPFRFYLQTNNLQRWSLSYDDPLNPTVQVDPFSQEVSRQHPAIAFADNLARHVTLGIELPIKDVFFARVGYSYRQMREMQYFARQSLNFSGFSYGFGFHAKRFDFSFARNNYHLGQAPNFISISFHL